MPVKVVMVPDCSLRLNGNFEGSEPRVRTRGRTARRQILSPRGKRGFGTGTRSAAARAADELNPDAASQPQFRGGNDGAEGGQTKSEREFDP